MNEYPKIVKKNWGEEQWLALNDKYCLKFIKITKGHKTSLQYHNQKKETTFISAGKVIITLKRKGDDKYSIYEGGPGTILDLEPGDIHRIEAVSDVEVFEASTPEVLDVVRISDDYGREGTSNP